MKTKSCKAKARVLQNEARDMFRVIAETVKPGILVADDIVGREMGQAGVDVRMSPAANRVLAEPLVECKNEKRLNVLKEYKDHVKKYTDKPGVKILIHTRTAEPGKPKEPRLVTMSLEDFERIYTGYLISQKGRNEPVQSS